MIILEIPIYSMSEDKFNKKWEKDIKNAVSQINEDNKISFEQYYKNGYVDQRQWIYNQIIGFLVIKYKNNSIWFDEYLTNDKVIRIKSNTKHYINNCRLSGFHFYVSNNMDNDTIKGDIIKWINSFEKEHLNKKYYLDKDKYLNILEYLDVKKMIDK